MHTLGVIILIAAILFVVIPSRTSVGEAMERRTTMTKLLKAIKIIAKTFAFGIAIIIIFALAAPDTPEEAAVKATQAARQAEVDLKANIRAHQVGAMVGVVKSSLRAPDSLKVRSVIVLKDGTICMSYSAQNGFGGMNTETIAANTTGVVDYAKNCNGKSGIDETSLAQTYAKWN